MKSFAILSIASLTLAAPLTGRAANFQSFTGALGGFEATPIVDSGNPDRPFQVKADTFVNIAAALQRSCDQQFNACANSANGGNKDLSVSACAAQQTECSAAPPATATATATAEATAVPAATATAAIECPTAAPAKPKKMKKMKKMQMVQKKSGNKAKMHKL